MNCSLITFVIISVCYSTMIIINTLHEISVTRQSKGIPYYRAETCVGGPNLSSSALAADRAPAQNLINSQNLEFPLWESDHPWESDLNLLNIKIKSFKQIHTSIETTKGRGGR